MYYTIYKITNLINGKIYVGKHKTKSLDDYYMGSGKRLRNAINKYGIENFKRELMYVFDEEWKMNLAEKILVVVDPEVSYNLCPGGHGGFGYINKNIWIDEKRKEHNRRISKFGDPEFREKYKDIILEGLKRGREKVNQLGRPNFTFKNKKHSDETKHKMSVADRTGKKNSQYGTMWITNGSSNKKIRVNQDVPLGWTQGRIMAS